MRKLTKNELIELRACKDMDNSRIEFFDRAARMYADDPEAVKKIQDLKKMYLDVKDMEDQDMGSVRAMEMSQNMYFDHVDALLNEMGYTAKKVEERKGDLIDVLKDYFGRKD
ncbi:MAG: hypothetical protein IJU30_01575 [Lachnospiraceae bacterium]|nr:hypothetical protein [Lachnospiraceae bacterium]